MQASKIAVKHKIVKIDNLIFTIKQIRKIFNKKLPSKVISDIQQKLTSYIRKHLHYFEILD
ncbi:hypothetical protein PsalMR5_01877 [Piscirickettsia salmonis]|uniref:hypothetical protein n=1 Tax=Piscirickettsia salmonis TaxID=1238 RepID=UPI0012BA999B|nr:hypothetical protein [Piscirickettsia salmonis]QGP54799.1 hypothetical protein PsalSR1_02240 [Piscirickettsia salmonis]QGP59308.1 hypothetical protein PsalBI1_01895 [Piscirickettsia salmonis]QGP64013.1 hypothetical protein PsalMR5_01877 [Piscirickettsia salmonis]